MKQFKEPLNTAVFTTKYVIYNGSPILFVFHDEDGSWQFHGPEDGIKDEDIKLVSLEEIIYMDNSLLELADLPVGFEAVRPSKDSKWQIVSSN